MLQSAILLNTLLTKLQNIHNKQIKCILDTPNRKSIVLMLWHACARPYQLHIYCLKTAKIACFKCVNRLQM